MNRERMMIRNAVDGLTESERQNRIEALKEGYKDEVCPVCDAVLLAHQHLVRCDPTFCPMIMEDKRSLAQMVLDGEGPSADQPVD